MPPPSLCPCFHPTALESAQELLVTPSQRLAPSPRHHNSPLGSPARSPPPHNSTTKTVFSFKHAKAREYHCSSKPTPLPSLPTPPIINYQQVTSPEKALPRGNNPPNILRSCSPELSTKATSPSHTRKCMSPAPTPTASVRFLWGEPRVREKEKERQQTSKMVGKRVQTEQETEYSSKHSHIFRHHADFPEHLPLLKTARDSAQIIFQEEAQSSQALSAQLPAPSFILQARTSQTIVTPTQMTSRSSSNVQPQLANFKESPLELPPLSSRPRITFQLDDLQEAGEEGSDLKELQSGMFYGESQYNFSKSPKISVLHLEEKRAVEDEEEELRDVIASQIPPLYIHSPICSINPSQKQVSDAEKTDRKNVSFLHISPLHSRCGSIEELSFLAQARAKMKRTNTIESIHSHESENSCIDIKFMHELRTRPRRGVSRLL